MQRLNQVSRGCAIHRHQRGEGLTDLIKQAYEKGKQLNPVDIYTGEIGTALRNLIPDSDEKARKGFPGEKHGILKLPNGKMGVANYMGPGTNIVARLKRGDPPRSEVDKVAKAHDIRYMMAKNAGDIRKADNIMIKKVKQISARGADSRANIAQASLMRAKVAAEDMRLLSKGAFGGDFKKNNEVYEQNKVLFDNNLKPLAQAGYGLGAVRGYGLPGDALKMKLLKTMKKKKKGSGVLTAGAKAPKSRDLGQAYKMLGSGILPKFVMDKIIPAVMGSIGKPKITLPPSVIKKHINKAIGMSKSIPSIVSNLSKTILPIVKIAKGMKGKGFGEMKDKLLENLGRGIFKAVKWFINKRRQQAGQPALFKGSGLNLPGGGFKEFFKAFKKTLKKAAKIGKPIAKVAGAVATATGNPEIGVPLSALGQLL